MKMSINTTKKDEQDINDFIEMQLDSNNEYTYCGYHGKQKAIGNYNECEQCLIEYKKAYMIEHNL